jgi:hypothetical protein
MRRGAGGMWWAVGPAPGTDRFEMAEPTPVIFGHISASAASGATRAVVAPPAGGRVARQDTGGIDMTQRRQPWYLSHEQPAAQDWKDLA